MYGRLADTVQGASQPLPHLLSTCCNQDCTKSHTGAVVLYLSSTNSLAAAVADLGGSSMSREF